MNVSSIELKYIVENLVFIYGKRLVKIIEPAVGIWGFHLDKKILLISVIPGYSWISVVENIPTRGEMSPFGMLLRKHLTGAFLEEIKLERQGDRIVRFAFSSGYSLCCELTGRHSNLFLLDENNIIKYSAYVSDSVSRNLLPGALYSLPAVFEQPQQNLLKQDIDYLSWFYEDYKNSIKAKVIGLLEKRRRTEIKRLEKLIGNIESDCKRAQKDLELRRLGDLIYITLSEWNPLERHKIWTEAPDGLGPCEIIFPEGVTRPVKAAEYFYKKYTKGRKTIEVASTRLIKLQDRLVEVKNREFTEDDIQSFMNEFKSGQKRKEKFKSEPGMRKYISEAGIIILCGKTASDNHSLTFSKARGNDYWFHVRDFPGSHVVAFTGNIEIDKETLKDAATIALLYSDARKNGSGDVMYARKKFVKAVKGQQGKVYVSSQTNIQIELDPTRLERLKKSVESELF
ncbi:DUF814 domain-containing protein [Myxococcota bacterium]|nr:DUF814 domain-containing protein [Myxococcota bacterium]MBU1382373.1 DUF814 domain-containing protein [Myxococcota bacterium]MBU1498710.1 DUF814 domain-containing protein [Myxococcota bacterium]